MTTVILHGRLGELFGEKWELMIKSPGEALRAIQANTGKLYDYLRTSNTHYRILLDDKDWKDLSELTTPFKSYETIHFIPVMEGAGSGIWEIVAGVLLIAVAVVLALPSGGTSVYGAISAETAITSGGAFSLASVSSFAITTGLLGASLVLGGVSSLLVPNPNGTQTAEKPADRPSYVFQGAVNTYTQGNAIPLLYGILTIGSQVIYAGTRASDIPTVQLWDSTINYAIDSEVEWHSGLVGETDSGFYRAKVAVPAGIVPSNTDYWDAL